MWLSLENCDFPPVVANAIASGRANTYLSSVRYTCSDGYDLTGNNVLVCTGSGQWSAAAPNCTGKFFHLLRHSLKWRLQQDQWTAPGPTGAITLLVTSRVARG